MPSNQDLPKILIVCDSASVRFGGEAALPLHYFRVLTQRGADVWLLVHARTRDELQEFFPDSARIMYIEDSGFHRFMWRLEQLLPDRIGYFTVGFASRLSTQWTQRRLARQIVREHGIDVIHQPIPVSPKEPSIMFDIGAPVVIGPMNGGMDYPPAFQRERGGFQAAALKLGRAFSSVFNQLMPGKPKSAVLLVANERTRQALPVPHPRVIEIVENGVDLSIWKHYVPERAGTEDVVPGFLFMGRLVDWKAVDLLLLAFQRAAQTAPMSMTIAGDGVERPALEAQALALGVLATFEGEAGKVFFAGWRTQAQCAQLLHQSSGLVLPSLLECGGAVVLEAMATGRPVIATDWGGPADYLDADCGIFVAPSSRDAVVDGFADALVTLAQSKDLRESLGRNGYDKVRRLYDWEAKLDVMLAIYRGVITNQWPDSTDAHQHSAI